MTRSPGPRPGGALPRPLEELVGDEVAPEELERLRAVDAILRSVPEPPPQAPPRASGGVPAGGRRPVRLRMRRRILAAAALAAALAALSFGAGTRVGDDRFDERAAVPMQTSRAAPAEARDASALIRVGEGDESGNWPLRLEVSGLPELPAGGYYALWLSRDGEYGGTCGTFRVGPDGSTRVDMNVSYRLRDFDAWVVTAHVPGEDARETPWLLDAPTRL